MIARLELYFLDIIKKKRQGICPAVLRGLLYLLSFPYSIITASRNWVFDHGWLSRYSPPVPVVISIGNIVAGGTGKTPVTLMLAKEFYSDAPLAILSRGYRSQAEKMAVPLVLSRGQGPMHPPSYCGDEPYMLSQNLPKAFVFVGRDRHKASDMAARAGAQLILMDDGMQHRRVARDFEVVVMDACDPFGLGYFLPRGLLRENLQALARADLIIINHVYDQERFIGTKKTIEQYTKAPVVALKTEIEKIQDLHDREIAPIAGRNVGVFCGIAHPDYFVNTVQLEGARVVASHFIPDHMPCSPAGLSSFSDACQQLGAELLICTEKDRVKLVEPLNLGLPVGWIKMKLVFVEGKEHWDQFIQRAKTNLAHRL